MSTYRNMPPTAHSNHSLYTQTGPYFCNPNTQDTATPLRPAEMSLQQMMTEDNWFWDTICTFTKPGGTKVCGTYRRLYEANPDLQQQIHDLYRSITDSDRNLASERQPDHFFTPSTNIDALENATEPAGIRNLLGAAEMVAVKNQGKTPLPVPNLQTRKSPTGTTTRDAASDLSTATSSWEKAHAVQGDEVLVEQDDAALPPMAESLAVQRQATPVVMPRQPEVGAPQYVDDIKSIADAHDILAHPDPEQCRKLQISGDDFEEIKADKLHFYAKRFFDAMLTPGVENPIGHNLTAKAKKKFDEQQAGILEKILKFVETPAQRKEARAHMMLAFEAAIFVHEIGVPKDIYDQYVEKGARKSDRYAHFDAVSICSVRLESMVQQVADYKLVAFDILSGKKNKLAYDPEYYSEQKIGYLISNTTRQETTDRVLAEKKRQAEAAKAKEGGEAGAEAASKRIRSAEVEPEQEAGGGDAEEPAMKRMRGVRADC
ncbi:hypothetical protein LTR08_002622 [Meristemomyces frigidus]|nr:hypothetical protein LTR08_002622 [Meristemomyces frigidus]